MKGIHRILSTATTALFLFPTAIAAQELPSWALGGFSRPEGINPIISPDTSSTFYCPMRETEVAWEANDTFNPAAAVIDGKIVVLYRAEDKSGVGIGQRTSRLGYASSDDGLHFSREESPVFYPDDDSQKPREWPGGCEDPRVVKTEDGLYVMLYTQWNRDVPRLAVATSRDLRHWEKHGPAFAAAYGGRFADEASKSASIVTRLRGGELKAVKVNGKYLMYWGEHHVYAATSDDLVEWTPVTEADGSLRRLISPREGYFDSQLTECGPPAVMTSKGILLMYNGKNHPTRGDKSYTPNVYAAGQVLFDREDPLKPVARLDDAFLRPADDFEKSGQYPAGTVFIEGLVYFHGKWYLYYGCADSRVAVAVSDRKLK